ncbi:MAG TPA: metallophosphoesterase [Baekduia sp.]|uniref:metallophosphoesterase n=1 Tax=Baekduia sp. TaxID=2600305 RepID=UPI002D768054|nr:metallophosphoesterase [Baekduia sp.]HET6506521.1 metallophosphoesterase [Baekduia sp.]
MRTLIISDLHLGSRLGRDVLRHREALDRLLAALDDLAVDRLVLLGDTVELAEGRPRQAMAVAEPVLRALGAALGARDGEVVVVPGNHDARLTRRWVRERGDALTLDTLVPHDASPTLAELTSWLAPARVTVRAPGFWVSDRVWATHGHHLDRHLLPESAWGLPRRAVRSAPLGAVPVVGPAAYERRRRPRAGLEARLTRSLPRPLATLVDNVAELLRAWSMPSARQLQAHRAAPVMRPLLGRQMQRSAIPALLHAAARIGVDADWIVFGHVHRSGPRAGDDAALWTGSDGRTRVANSGSWIYEPLLLHHRRAPHPYWPGGAIVVDDDGDPRAIGLLDDLDARALFARVSPGSLGG